MFRFVRYLYLPLLAQTLLLAPIVSAQYDGSFDDIYFNRTFSPKSEALGRNSVTVKDNVLSLQANSSLIGFMDGVILSYSHSSPYYFVPKGNHELIGLAFRVGSKIGLGVARADYQFEVERILEYHTELLTLAFVVKPTKNLSLAVNGRQISLKVINTKQGGESIYDHQQWYLDTNAAFRYSYDPKFSDRAELIAGFTYQNLLRNAWSPPSLIDGINISRPLPVILTSGLSHEVQWGTKNFLTLILFGEYQKVTNSDFYERISVGTELGLSGLLKARIGYFTQTRDDKGFDETKEVLKEMTYGFGVVLPISQLLGTSNTISLEFDYALMQQPVMTHVNYFGIGDFTMFSATVKAEL